MKVPVPETALGLAIERLVSVFVSGVVGVVLLNWPWGTAGKWGVLYFVLKTAWDVWFKDIPNAP